MEVIHYKEMQSYQQISSNEFSAEKLPVSRSSYNFDI